MTSPSPDRPPERDFVKEYRRREAEQRETGQWQRLAASATEFAGAIGLGLLAGWGVDKWLDTKPWGLAIGTLIGFAIGLFLLWRAAAHMFK